MAQPHPQDLKYIRHSHIGFVLWRRTDALYHSDMASGVKAGPDVRGSLLSAGFASLLGGVVRCWGRSDSLDLDSRVDDSQALAAQLGLST